MCVHMCAVVCVHVYTFVGSAENFGCPSLSSVYLVFYYYLFICSYLSKFYLQLGTFQVGLLDWLMSSREPSVPVSPVLGLEVYSTTPRLLFTWVLEIELVLVLGWQMLYQLNYLPSP